MKWTHSVCLALLIAAAPAAHAETPQTQPESRRGKIIRFIAAHPIAAQAIGMESSESANITSNAIRFARRTGLDDRANGDGRGTQVNAVRHTLWQAAIAARFDPATAEAVGHAYEINPVIDEAQTDYPSRYAADEAVDLRNNRIGRRIGSERPQTDMKTLALSVLAHFSQEGLWMAEPVETNGQTAWRISQTKLNHTQYEAAVRNLGPLNENGFTDAEQRRYENESPSEIEQAIEAIRKHQ
ncbi:hypothetical protein LVJ83_06465 [Uruburuella testudinis]|uniref:DUF6973 domain-containing protein n=1 Tax=Uruburuella testudinis TaxID=1282863 RepID=A0ABY4DZU1_9NEIS|nr:hypothetical protein [Uruburuella testudinis]UOO83097.1 hypothetical protein LVJ83_06465 [Uruburuella testudinis]